MNYDPGSFNSIASFPYACIQYCTPSLHVISTNEYSIPLVRYDKFVDISVIWSELSESSNASILLPYPADSVGIVCWFNA